MKSVSTLALDWMIRSFVLCLFTLTAVGCGDAANSDSAANSTKTGGKDKVILQLNWYPEAEHGGFYAAQIHGIYEKYNLDVEIRSGGRVSAVPQELVLGRIQFGISNGDELLISRNEGIDVLALMAPLQTSPRCVLVRKESGITSFDKLGGLTLQVGQGQPFVDFLKSKGYLDNVKLVPFQGNVAALVSEAGVAQQGYVFSEPFLAEEKNVPVNSLMVSDAGFNPYSSILIATTSYVDQNPDITERMVKASIEGWKKYLEEPAQTNAKILELNSEGMTAAALTYGVEKMKPLCLPEGTTLEQVGRMTPERWSELVSQMVELKLVDPAKVTAEKCYRGDWAK